MSRLESINREIKHYDNKLYAVDTGPMVQIYRKGVKFDAYDFDGNTLLVSQDNPIFILPLTDDWKLTGKPVEWGLEPLMQRLRSMDQWNLNIVEDFQKDRERLEENKKRARSNEFRALAADLRKDFAKATNDINTASLEKTDNRRKKDGSCK